MITSRIRLFFSNRSTLWKVWWKVCHLRLVCASLYTSPHLWWVQLRLVPRKMRDLRRSWRVRCVLLQGMHNHGERRKTVLSVSVVNIFTFLPIFLERWLSENCEFGKCQNGSFLWAKEVRFQEKITVYSRFAFILASVNFALQQIIVHGAVVGVLVDDTLLCYKHEH